MAAWDPERAERLMCWPLRDLLLAYIALLKREAESRYRFDLGMWARLAPHQKSETKPPKAPKILRS